MIFNYSKYNKLNLNSIDDVADKLKILFFMFSNNYDELNIIRFIKS